MRKRGKRKKNRSLVAHVFIVAVSATALLVPVPTGAEQPSESFAMEVGKVAGWRTFSSCMSTYAWVIAEEVDKLYRSRAPLKERDADRYWSDEGKQVMDIVRKQVDACDEKTSKQLELE